MKLIVVPSKKSNNCTKSVLFIEPNTQWFCLSQNLMNQNILVWFFIYWNIIKIKIFKFNYVIKITTRRIFNTSFSFLKFILLYFSIVSKAILFSVLTYVLHNDREEYQDLHQAVNLLFCLEHILYRIDS